MRPAILLLLLAVAPRSLGSQPVPFEEIPADGIQITLAGNAVVRDQASWETLWHRFGRIGYDGDRVVRALPPPVDFTRRMVVVAALGVWPSGCSDRARIVRGVTARPDSIVVTVGQHMGDGGDFTCAMVVHPQQFVSIPRSRLPVAFHGAPERVPGRAPWWDTPTIAQMEAMRLRRQPGMPNLLLLDPRTPLPRVLEVLDHVRVVNPRVAELLLQRADVRASAAASGRVAAAAGRDARRVRADVFDLHGVTLARSRRTRPEVLALLAEELRERHPRPPAVAAALVRHPTVLADSAMLRRLVFQAQSLPEVRIEGCRAFAARYPLWVPMRRADGTATRTWVSALSVCSDLFPQPSSPPPGDPAS